MPTMSLNQVPALLHHAPRSLPSGLCASTSNHPKLWGPMAFTTLSNRQGTAALLPDVPGGGGECDLTPLPSAGLQEGCPQLSRQPLLNLTTEATLLNGQESQSRFNDEVKKIRLCCWWEPRQRIFRHVLKPSGPGAHCCLLCHSGGAPRAGIAKAQDGRCWGFAPVPLLLGWTVQLTTALPLTVCPGGRAAHKPAPGAPVWWARKTSQRQSVCSGCEAVRPSTCQGLLWGPRGQLEE